MAYTPIHLSESDVLKSLPESIGQVSLNYDFYPGQDLYSDGTIEDELLATVKDASKVEYPGIIDAKKSWPFLYHLSNQRGNIVDFLPIGKTDKVLEIGSGCGAITDTLSSKALKVECVDLSAKRSQINAYRNSDKKNITIHVGNFKDIEPTLDDDFDYILLIGVFEYGELYIDSSSPFEDFLKTIKKHIKDTGRIVIAIENKFGLKYWAGCREDHNGKFFSSLEGYPDGKKGARTFTYKGLEKIFKACGIDKDKYHFYYPYPDYKLMHTLYSDLRLPNKGELTDNLRNFDRNRMMLFNESYVYDSVIEDEEFPLFSNSYLVILGEDIPVTYAKYSNDRADEYAISTIIKEDSSGKKTVVKKALTPEAYAHIKALPEYFEALNRRYEGSKLKINVCTYDEEAKEASFEYIEGRTLEEILDEHLFAGRMDEFKALFKEYCERIAYNEKNVPVTDYDLIFANILVNGDEWTVIDYEWTFKKDISYKKIAYRALYCYLIEDARRNAANADEMLDIIGITAKEAESYLEDELEFQKSVTANHRSLGELKATIGTYEPDAVKLVENSLKEILDKRIQLYFDTGAGFNETESRYVPDVYKDENTIVTDVEFTGDVRTLRIDPADSRCAVRINELVLNGNNVLSNKRFIESNGKTVNNTTYVFDTTDPNLVFKLNEVLIGRENVLHVEMEVDPISEKMAGDICKNIKKLF